MSNGSTGGASGRLNIFGLTYEIRRIVVGQGIDFRDNDITARQSQGYSERTLVEFLQSNFTSNFTLIDSKHMRYVSDEQQVVFLIEITHNKQEFKTALSTPGIHVIYQGHSRYGGGSCFDPDVASSNYLHGERWEHGDNSRNGLFRLAYPYVGIPFEDIEHHQYNFAPVPVEVSPPSVSDRHPESRRGLSRITLPEPLRRFVITNFQSISNKYWGFRQAGKNHILLNAGWENTRNDPFDLGATELRCKVFCHFGCSSKLHYWRIVRTGSYKNWARDNPPTDKFAYFTTAPADYRCSCYWLFYLMNYPEINNNQSWWSSVQYAKAQVNRLLRTERAGFQLY